MNLKRSKYGVSQTDAGKKKRTNASNVVFDSVAEREYSDFLCSLGVRYQKQVSYEIWAGRDSKYGKLLAITYTADFVIGNIVIDVKGFETNEFKRTKKMFVGSHPGVHFVLVKKKDGRWEHYEYSLPTATKKPRARTIHEIMEDLK
jgi:hypothetical protein